MIKILPLCASLLLFPFLANAEHEKKPEHLTLFATMLSTTAVQCAPSDNSKNIFKPEQIVFTGFIDQNNIFKVYLTEDNIWSGMLENSAGLSCIYFTGTPGIVKKPKGNPS